MTLVSVVVATLRACTVEAINGLLTVLDALPDTRRVSRNCRCNPAPTGGAHRREDR